MLITNLNIKSFRTIEDLELNLNKKNIFIGQNAAGKTSILESIYYLAYTKSYKSNFSTVVNFDSDFLKITAATSKGKFTLVDSQTKTKLSLNNVVFEKKVDYIGKLLVVLFNPSDLELVSSEPAFKRKWLNMVIGTVNNNYLNNLNIYNQLLKQRNLLLKQNIDEIMLDINTKQLSHYNALIVDERKKFINEINQYLEEYSLKISKKVDFASLEYNYTENLYEKLKSKLDYDMLTKTTNYGLHRDNIIFKINSYSAKEYASQGQIRSILLALTLSIIKYYQSNLNELPILLLDDVFSELDENRINSLFSSIDDELQVLMTTTDLKNIEKFNLKDVKIFNIEKGKLLSGGNINE